MTTRPIDPARAIVRSLTPKQRDFVRCGRIHGDFTMRTVYALQVKGLFHHVVSAPDGRHGFMRLTPLGQRVQAALDVPAATSRDGDAVHG